MGTLYINSSKGKTLRSLIQAARSGTGTITSNGDGTVSLGDGTAYLGYDALPASAADGARAVTADGTVYVMRDERWTPEDAHRDWVRNGPQAPGTSLAARTSAADNQWHAVAYVPTYKRLVAVGLTGTGNRVMTSDDGGINWVLRASAADNSWLNVMYIPKYDRLVAVAASGTGNRVMTSDDGGVTWATRPSAADLGWIGIGYDPKNDSVVAVAFDGTGSQIMTSGDGGLTWTLRSNPAPINASSRAWSSVTWDATHERLVAVSSSTITDYQIIYSSDGGVTWTTANSPAATGWRKVIYIPTYRRLVAVGDSGTSNRVMTSDDGGATWTIRTSAGDKGWMSVVWAPKYDCLIAVANAGTGNRAMVSYNGGVTWAFRAPPSDNNWRGSCYDPDSERMVAVATSGTGNRVMTSGSFPVPLDAPSLILKTGGIASVASWSALPTLGANDRAVVSVPRLCGHGMFLAAWNGTRWAVLPGQVIISDAGVGTSVAGYDLTATGTTFVSLVSYEVPADMIGDGEEWFASALMRNNGVYVSGTDTVQVRWQSLTTNGTLLSTAGAAAANRGARGEGRMTRLGTTLVRRPDQSGAGSIAYTSQTIVDQTLDLSLAQTIEAGFTPGASTNTMRLRHWAVGRFA